MPRPVPRSSGDETDSLGTRAVSAASWTGLQSIVLTPVNFVTTVVVARLLGPLEFGRLAALTAFLAVATPLVDLGFGAACMQFAGGASGRGDRGQVNSLFNKLVGFHLLWQVPVLAIGGLFILRESSPVLQALYVVVLLVGVFTGNAAVRLVVDNRGASNAQINIVGGITTSTLLVGLAASHASAAQIWLGRSLFGAIPALLVLRLLTGEDRRSLFRPAVPLHLPDGFWPYARGMWVAVALGAVVANRIEVFVLRGNGLAAGAGVFAVTFGLATQITAPLDLLQAPLGPALNALAGRGGGGLGQAVARTLPIFSLGAATILALSSGLVPLLTTIYGEDYASGKPLLIILLVASCVSTAFSPYAALAVARRRRRVLPAVQAVCAILDVGLALALVPLIGVTGAAVAAAVALGGANLLFARCEVGGWSPLLRAVAGGPVTVGGLAFACGLIVSTVASGPFAQAGVAFGVSGAVVAGGLWWFQRQIVRQALTEVAPALPSRLRPLLNRLARAGRT